MLKKIIDAIVFYTLELVQDPYGNYVVQHVLAITTDCLLHQYNLAVVSTWWMAS